MKNICLFFQIHQPLLLKRYRFFDIGQNHYYYDDFQTEENLAYVVENSYIKANNTLLEMIRSSNGKFRCSFALSGLAIELFEQYAPEVIDSFRELAKTASVEFLAMPYSNSPAAVYDLDEFERQAQLLSDKIEELFGKRPTTFFNTEMIYSDEIGEKISKMGYRSVFIDEAKHVMGWKSPNYIYCHSYMPKLQLLVRNNKLSDDIALNFQKLSLKAEDYIRWVASLPEGENQVNIGMSYDALGILQPEYSGIFNFLKSLPYFAMEQQVGFVLPRDIAKSADHKESLSVPYPMSWAGSEKNLTAWTGNDLQQEALNKLYAVSERVNLCADNSLKHDWLMLQSIDNFRYMSHVDAYKTHYETAYDAFVNYMNVLADFLQRVNAQYPTSIENEELNALLKTINNQESEIAKLEGEIAKLKKRS